MTNVLLIVEGEKAEKNLLEKMISEYKINGNIQIYPYKTNIYNLYKIMFEGREDDMSGITLMSVLRARDKETEFLNKNFSDIILIFDYEAQDNLFSPEKIELMINYFNNSTENGKLYINYPMVESYKHLKEYPEDKEYKNRMIKYEDIKNYKAIVGKEAKIADINKFKRKNFNSAIIQNIKKANYILNGNYEIKNEQIQNTYLKIDDKKITKKQNEILNSKEKSIYVLNTSLFFVCDYKFELIIE